jgi:hypothetical protein
VSITNSPVIVYVPSMADENGCGRLVVVGVENPALKDSIMVCVTGVNTRPISAITRDYDGCGYLDRIEMKFRKPIYFKNGETGASKIPKSNEITVKYSSTVLTVDSVTVNPKDSTVVIWLNDVAPHTGALQTDWLPVINIGDGFFMTKRDDGVLDPVLSQTVKEPVVLDGAAPVIANATLILENNLIVVRFSEKIKPYSAPSFLAAGDTRFPPEALFNIWRKGATANKMHALSKTKDDPNGGEVWALQGGKLNGIGIVYGKDGYTLMFDLGDIKIDPKKDYINIRTEDQAKNPHTTEMRGVADIDIIPKANNRKVQITYGTIEDAVASSDRVIPAARPGDESAAIAPIAPLTAEFAAGPNPASRSSDVISFFRSGSRATYATLSIYDATGNIVRKIRVIDDAAGNQSKRKVSSWNLLDSKGCPVSDGTYLVRGTIKTKDGKTERVSVTVVVR